MRAIARPGSVGTYPLAPVAEQAVRTGHDFQLNWPSCRPYRFSSSFPFDTADRESAGPPFPPGRALPPYPRRKECACESHLAQMTPETGTSNSLPKSTYRAEVDGLRAIAVVSVLLYHAKFLLLGQDWFEGGYIGVDIFFVISGYLVTRVILSEIYKSGSFSFMNFYERRARRILPMLLIVILLSMPFAWQILLPPEMVKYAGSLLASLFFGSNLFFYINTTEYGAASSLLEPFLHTWSLGIEEQFYFLFPIFLIVAFRCFRKYFFLTLAALTFASLLFSELMQARNSDFNFYLPFSRFWELSLGSILAWRELRQKSESTNSLTQFLPVIGLGLIVYSILFFDGNIPHPSSVTIIPILGAVLIIRFASNDDVVGRVLGSKPFVWTGLISYSMYLWHYPIFAFSRINSGEPANFEKLVWIMLTISLSVASYFLIEKPFRRASFVGRRGFLVLLSSGFLIVTALGVSTIETNGFERRLPEFLRNVDTSVSIWKSRFIDGEQCYDRVENFCTNKLDEKAITVYAFGDSHFSSMSETLFQAIAGEFNYVEANMAGCPFVLDVDRITNGKVDKCSNAYQKTRLDIISDRPAILILGGRMPLYLSRTFFDNEEGGRERSNLDWPKHFESVDGTGFKKKLTDTYRRLLDDGHHIVLVYPIPSVGVNVPARLFSKTRGMPRADIQRLLVNDPLTTSSDVYHRRSREAFELLDSVVHPNLHRVYPHELFCDLEIAGRCRTHDSIDVYYFDDDHPSVQGSKLISEWIYREVKAAESKLRLMPSLR